MIFNVNIPNMIPRILKVKTRSCIFVKIKIMRKKLLFIFFITLSVFLNAQNFQLFDKSDNLVNGDTITFYEYYNSNSSSNAFSKDKFLKFYNNTGSVMVMELSRTEVKIIPGSQDYYCYGQQCLGPVVAGASPFRTSNDTLRVEANSFGVGSAPFAIYLDFAQGDTAIYDYTFTDKLNRSNKATVFIRWIVIDNSANGPNFQIQDSLGNIINGDTIVFNQTYNDSVAYDESFVREKFIQFYNSTPQKQELTMLRAERQVITGSYDSYCISNVCTPPILAGSERFKFAQDTLKVFPMSSTGDSAFSVGLDTANGGTAIYSYTFTDTKSKNNSATVFVRWNVVDVTSLEESIVDGKFSIYPNPAVNTTTLNFERELNFDRQEVQLFNILGEQVFLTQLKKGTKAFELNVESLPKGIYFVNVVANGARLSSKKMIVK